MRIAPELKQNFIPDSCSRIAFIIFFVTCLTVTVAPSESVANSCIQCHGSSSFLTANKKLYKYFRDWESSIHAMENVNCNDCHGGNPYRTDKKEAHGESIQQLMTPVLYAQISSTCGKCHKKNADNYKKSNHYRVLTEKGKPLPFTPTCITCHGSINTAIPSPDDIADICTKCHNAVTENHPEIPQTVSYLIERLSFINYYTRVHITKADVLKENPQLLTTISKEFSELSQIWHTLELDEIAKKTMQIRTMLMKERKLLDEKRKKQNEK